MKKWLRRIFLCWWGGCGGRVYTTTCTYPNFARESLLTHEPCYLSCNHEVPYWQCDYCGRTSDDG